MDDTKVALVKHSRNHYDTLSRGLKLLSGFGEPNLPILIKPNICTTKDDTGYSVTDVHVVKDLIRLVLESGRTSVRIVESNSQSKFAMEAFTKFEYDKMVDSFTDQGYDVCLIDLSQEPLVDVDFEGRYFDGSVRLHPVLTNPHYFISLAVAKTHYLTFITGALKNLFGLLPRKDMSFYHSRIDDVILDLLNLIQPDLSVIDARVGVEGWNGPSTKEIGAFILSKSSVSADAILTRLIGHSPSKAPHLTLCAEHGFNSLDPEVVGDSLDSLAVKLKEP